MNGSDFFPAFAPAQRYNLRTWTYFTASVLGFVSLLNTNPIFANPAPTVSQADATKGEVIYTQGLPDRQVPACMSCHGAQGNSGGGVNPRLAGQHAAYIEKQLHHFKNKNERYHAVMTPYAQQLTDAEMANVAAYLALQTPKIGKTKSADAPTLGQKIYRAGIAEKGVPACAACHGPAGSGIPAKYPRLGGQSSEYTQAQLLAFKANRQTGPAMRAMVLRMNEQEMKAVSDYISAIAHSK